MTFICIVIKFRKVQRNYMKMKKTNYMKQKRKLFGILDPRILRVILFVLLTGQVANITAQADPSLTALDTTMDAVTITNLGDADIDITNYWVCLGPGMYGQLSALPIVSGDFDLSPAEQVTFTFNLINESNGGLGLFSTNSFGSSSPTILLDYVQWGGPNQARVGQAVTAGRWDNAANFVSCPAPYSTVLGGSAIAWGEADGGTVQIDATATGNPNNTTSIAADGLSAVICVDGRMDPLVVTHDNPGVDPGVSYRYVVTDNSVDNNILAIFATNAIDLDGAGIGTCRIWGWSYLGVPNNGADFIGDPLADLQAQDCSDLSDNAIDVIREEADGGTVVIDIAATGNPNNTTSIAADGLSAVICVDGRMDPLIVTHTNTAPNLTFRYVVTDDSPDNTILAVFNSPSINLDGAGIGTCRIWGWSYRGLDGSAFVGQPLANLQAEDCSDISDNNIDVIREAADGGTVQIDIAATGNPNNTTSIAADGHSAVICVDGNMDPLVVTHANDSQNLTYRYVVTDTSADNTILAIFNTNSIDLDGAGIGTCRIWGWSYRGLDQNAFIGSPLLDLQSEDCSDISSNNIEVIREEADGGTVQIDAAATGNPNGTTSIAADGLSAIICVDGRMDPLVVTHVNDAPNLTFRYVVTDDSADNNILAIFNTNSIDLDGAGIGTCRIWGWSYRGLDQNAFIGMPLQTLQDEDCSDISDNNIDVIREAADGGTVVIDIAATGNPNNTTSIAADGLSAVICVDGRADPLVVTHTNTAPNLTFRYVVTDNSADNTILAIFNTPSINLDGAGIGTCRIWGWSYRGLDGSAFIGMPLQTLQDEDCSDISDNNIDVIREAADGGTVQIDIAATGNPNNTTSIAADGLSAVICVDGQADPLVVTHVNDSPNLSYRYVITDAATDIVLNIVDTNTISLDGAGVGTCQIWGWSYRGFGGGADFIGGPLSDIEGADCSDISDNAITVVREAADGGTVQIDVAATGNPNNTTTIAADGLSAVICVDGRMDPLVVIHNNDSPNLTYRYVVTDNSPDSIILAIADTNTIDLDGAGPGTCLIWGWSYRGLDQNAFIGLPLADLQAEACSDISSNAIQVIREEADAGTVSLANGDTEVTICAGDGAPDPLELAHVNDAPNLSYRYVVTDSDADNTILAIPVGNIIDLDGAGVGVCRIWGWSYRGLDPASFIGQPLATIGVEDCSDVSADFVQVTRVSGADCDILAVDDFDLDFDLTVYPNPARDVVNVVYSGSEAVNLQVIIYDLLGRNVYQNNFESQNSVQIDVTSLTSGTYLLNIIDGNSGVSTTKKIVKQ